MKRRGPRAGDAIPKSPDAPDALQRQLLKLMAQCRATAEKRPHLFRLLCAQAWKHRLSPESFRSRLVRAGLAYSRASELKVVLASRSQCTAFLGVVANGQLRHQSWKRTLARARAEAWARESGRDATQQLAARVAGGLHRCRLGQLELQAGWLVIEPRAGDLESLSQAPLEVGDASPVPPA